VPFSPAPLDDADSSDAVTPQRAAAVFKALADPLRIQLVALTASTPDGSICFCDIAARLEMPQSSLSHHMRVLVDAGILERERRGTWSWYRLREEPFHLLQHALRPGGVLLTPSPLCYDQPTGRKDSRGHRQTA
jgi:DNA-binding transcriptional ArsR family regulator